MEYLNLLSGCCSPKVNSGKANVPGQAGNEDFMGGCGIEAVSGIDGGEGVSVELLNWIPDQVGNDSGEKVGGFPLTHAGTLVREKI